MGFFIHYLKDRRKIITAFFVCCAIFLCSFILYRLPVKAVLYPAGISLAIIIFFAVFDFRRVLLKHRHLTFLTKLPDNLTEALARYETADDSDYKELIRLLREEESAMRSHARNQASDMIEYYTLWVHQIKTPIASMHLTLQNEDTSLSRQLSDDLFRIEQYVEMVLCYLRLGSGSSDYLFREYSLDDIIKQALRRFSGQFIGKNIKLNYSPLEINITTDEKWLLFVVEQVLSNALKYTPSGGTITISLEAPAVLCIRDTGIGIAPEDIPLIFSRGYTGYNGREDKRASGIGLYLCRRICENLGHTITASSAVDKGTSIRIDLETYKLITE